MEEICMNSTSSSYFKKSINVSLEFASSIKKTGILQSY